MRFIREKKDTSDHPACHPDNYVIPLLIIGWIAYMIVGQIYDKRSVVSRDQITEMTNKCIEKATSAATAKPCIDQVTTDFRSN